MRQGLEHRWAVNSQHSPERKLQPLDLEKSSACTHCLQSLALGVCQTPPRGGIAVRTTCQSVIIFYVPLLRSTPCESLAGLEGGSCCHPGPANEQRVLHAPTGGLMREDPVLSRSAQCGSLANLSLPRTLLAALGADGSHSEGLSLVKPAVERSSFPPRGLQGLGPSHLED